MAHFTAYTAADFTKLPGLQLIGANPVYSGQSETGFTATKGALSLKISRDELVYDGGTPVQGRVTLFEGSANGAASFRIDMLDATKSIQNVGNLIDRVANEGVAIALDVLLNAIDDDLIEGSDFDDRLFGFGGADVIEGNKGKDRLDGGYDDDGQTAGDVLDGGAGRDVLIGGKDTGQGMTPFADTFVFSVKAKKANADKVEDFLEGDEIHLDNLAFKALKTEGGLKSKYFAEDEPRDGNDHLIYDRGSGKLFYDKDGDGGAEGKLIAAFKGKPDIEHDDIFVV